MSICSPAYAWGETATTAALVAATFCALLIAGVAIACSYVQHRHMEAARQQALDVYAQSTAMVTALTSVLAQIEDLHGPDGGGRRAVMGSQS
jgi:hypothetical protein